MYHDYIIVTRCKIIGLFFIIPLTFHFWITKHWKKNFKKKCFAFNFRNWVFLKYPDIYYKRIFVKEPPMDLQIYLIYPSRFLSKNLHIYLLCDDLSRGIFPLKQTSKPLPPSKPSDYGFCNPKPGRFFKRSPKNQITGLRKFFHFIFLKPLLLLLLNYQIPAPTLGLWLFTISKPVVHHSLAFAQV